MPGLLGNTSSTGKPKINIKKLEIERNDVKEKEKIYKKVIIQKLEQYLLVVSDVVIVGKTSVAGPPTKKV